MALPVAVIARNRRGIARTTRVFALTSRGRAFINEVVARIHEVRALPHVDFEPMDAPVGHPVPARRRTTPTRGAIRPAVVTP